MNLKERIDEALEHYDYVLVAIDVEPTDNIVSALSDWGATLPSLYRYLTIVYGAGRVSKSKRKVRIDNGNK